MPKIVAIFIIFFMSCSAYAQNKMNIEQYANFEKYKEANQKIGLPAASEQRVVFMGNSITEAWQSGSPEFFKDTGYINRGIGGQVTHQMLLRFRADVIDLKPKIVVILAGTNDLAQNSGFVPIQ